MRMLDVDKRQSVHRLQLYLSPDEASAIRDYLGLLLQDPEANEHHHVFDRRSGREISFSIVTPQKLQEGRYTKLERSVLEER